MFPVTTTKIDFPDLLIDHFRVIIDTDKTYEYNVTSKKGADASTLLPIRINF